MLGVFGAYSTWTIMAALRQTDAALSPAAANTLGDFRRVDYGAIRTGEPAHDGLQVSEPRFRHSS